MNCYFIILIYSYPGFTQVKKISNLDMISVQPTKVTLKAEDVHEMDELLQERAQQQQQQQGSSFQSQGSQGAHQPQAHNLDLRGEEIKRRIGATR